MSKEIAINDLIAKMMDESRQLREQVNTLEGTLENIQCDNVEKEGRIDTLEAENEAIQGRLATWQAVKDANATVCAERDELKAELEHTTMRLRNITASLVG